MYTYTQYTKQVTSAPVHSIQFPISSYRPSQQHGQHLPLCLALLSSRDNVSAPPPPPPPPFCLTSATRWKFPFTAQQIQPTCPPHRPHTRTSILYSATQYTYDIITYMVFYIGQLQLSSSNTAFSVLIPTCFSNISCEGVSQNSAKCGTKQSDPGGGGGSDSLKCVGRSAIGL